MLDSIAGQNASKRRLIPLASSSSIDGNFYCSEPCIVGTRSLLLLLQLFSCVLLFKYCESVLNNVIDFIIYLCAS